MSHAVWNEFQRVIKSVPEKRVWGLSRTHGSMFFLELGEATHSSGEDSYRGEMSFTSECGFWRLFVDELLVLACEDQQPHIDEALRSFGDATVQDLSVDYNGDVSLLTDRWRLEVIRLQTELNHYDPWVFRSGADYWQLQSDGSLVKE